MPKTIYLDAPNVGKLEKDYLIGAIDSGYVSTIGPYVAEFEKKFAAYLGVKKAVSTKSGTAAIRLALYELEIGRGDEVLVPVLTFIATANAAIHVGAKPVFVDVDIDTWAIDPCEIEKSITKKTKAIIPVHLYGNPCNMDEILKIAREHKIYVIEDACQSLGAVYNKRYTGTFGEFGCFSFNGNKIITTGGGGMIVGNNEEKLNHLKFLVNQARDESDEYYHPEIGFNDRMTNIEAALGLAQLKRLNSFLEKKRAFNDIYRSEFENIKYIHFQKECQNAKSSYWLPCIIFERDIDIVALKKDLKKKGIITRRIFMPIVEFPPYKAYKRGDYRNSYRIHEKGLCLPASTLNSDDDIYHVCKVIKEVSAKRIK